MILLFLGLSMLSTEFILGLPLKQTGIYPGVPEGPHHVIQYGVTLVLSSLDSRYSKLDADISNSIKV